MKKVHAFATIVPAVALLVALVFVGCKKKDDDAPPPLPAPPSAAPAATPSAPIAIAPEEDAGSDASDAAADAKKVVGGPAPDSLGLRACCNALAQNAMSLPPPQNVYAQQAAALCSSLAASGQSKAALGPVLGMLKGIAPPAACR